MSVVRRVPFFLVSFPVSLLAVSEKSEKVERQRARRIRRHVIALGAVLMLGSHRGWPQEPPSGAATVTPGIEVSPADRTVFYIAVVREREMLRIVPIPAGPFAGIRITPRM